MKQAIKAFLTKLISRKVADIDGATIVISDGAGRKIEVKVGEGQITEEITEVVDLEVDQN